MRERTYKGREKQEVLGADVQFLMKELRQFLENDGLAVESL